MGWPRRRRQQQQQLRRRAAKDYLLACCTTAIDMCGATSLLAPVVSAKAAATTQLTTKRSAAAATSPLKPHAPSSSTGRRRHTGLREKLYSVDSLAETEPEDNDDDDDDDETASESSPLSHYHTGSTAKLTKLTAATPLQIEPTIPEETVSKVQLETDDGDSVETDDDDEADDTEAAAELDSDDTDSEDELTLDAVVSNCSVTVEEVPVVVASETAATSSVDLFGQSIAVASETKTQNSENSAPESQHAPFLFPAPYFPGDVDEYESDIYETLLRREKTYHVESDYFGFQPHVTPLMRSMLLDWVVEVHNHFNLQPDTLYLTVNYIDRFLAAVPVQRENFQLVALTAMLISSKFEEVHPVDIDDLVYICEKSYTAQQIVQFERQMLSALQFNLVVPTCSGFLDYYTDKLHAEVVEAQLANFICEQTLLDFHLSAKYLPSVVASSALLLAKCSVANHKPELSWILEFEETTGYYAKDVWCCVHDLSDMLASLSFDLVAVRTKYRSSRFGRVSDLPHVNISTMAIE